MKTLKSVLFLSSLFYAIVFMQSCEEEAIDLCADVECNDYDAECVDGDCECREITKDYILGTWDHEGGSSWVKFKADGVIESSLQVQWTYTVNTVDKIIYVHSGGSLTQTYYIQDGFDCNQFVSESHPLNPPGTFVRRL